jgi:uncharacterized protein (TIGR02118 family)
MTGGPWGPVQRTDLLVGGAWGSPAELVGCPNRYGRKNTRKKKPQAAAGRSLLFLLRVSIFSDFLPPLNRNTMVKLIALYRKPADPAAFDAHYDSIHTPLVRKYPGLRRLEITRVTGAPIGETKFHLLAEMSFDDRASMDAALASPEGRAVIKDLMSFAADIVTVFIGETAGS